ncbi:MAG: c-type cytochrome, partial [Thiolinea sp.]
MASIPKDPYAKPVLIGSLVILGTTVAVLVSNLFTTIDRNATVGAQDTSMFEAAATANLKPIGTVATVDKSIAPVARTGEQVFNAVCTSCHTAGVLNAPKIDDKAAWEPRITKGLQGLMASATNGLNQMPAKGGDPSLTDQELTDAVLYMTGKAGFDLAKDAGTAAAAPAA